MKEIIITKDNAGGRLDKILAKYIDKAPKSFVYKMLRKKNIVLNDRKAAGSEIVQAGDSIKLYLADDTIEKFQSRDSRMQDRPKYDKLIGSLHKNDHKSSPNPLPEDWIVYEDDNLIAVHKPAGVLSQQSKAGEVTINEMLKEYLLRERQAEGQKPAERILFTPGISNRLDRNTSGLVIAGKTLYASRELNRAIRDRSLKKQYLCIVKGIVEKGDMLDGYLVKDEKSNTVSVMKEKDALMSRRADRIITAYEPLQRFENATLLEVDLITGKSHQIRAHLASIGHPIIGDVKYGEKEINTEYRKRFGTNRQLLHAYKLIFQQMTGELAYLNGQHVEAPLPEDFSVILNLDK